MIIYDGPNCPACEALKEFLEKRGVKYTRYSIEDPACWPSKKRERHL